MNMKRAVYWQRDKHSSYNGRTCTLVWINDNPDFNECKILFDGQKTNMFARFSDLYFQDHLDGYNQFK